MTKLIRRKKGKRKTSVYKRTWFPKQLTKAEFAKRHAEHLERQRKMGIPENQMDMAVEGRGELSRMGRA